ncbi:Uncharacterized membrane protein YeiB [Haloechinothrix alba]|uniref:Uncharacterized membrane protein YeiB n=1 Tax=Haloechinothrix alba TaxID=664784 RepID=A0A238W358_9PSEU|nr:DUF418 domain-containing protein [Haloechinothrix alba]SNR40841.1 Uncharacterized membrane protein YeiB [Haloechinothrix alba]
MTTGPAHEETRAARGPVRADERSLAPDLARGLMLLLIVLSNTAYFLWGTDYNSPGEYPEPESLADSATQFLMIAVLDVRVYPLFAFLFGYGMVQLYHRQLRAGSDERAAQVLLRRRSLWLVLFGFVHAALLLATEVLAAYGLISLVLGWLFLRRRMSTMLTWCAVGTGVLTVGFVMAAGTVVALASGALTIPGEAELAGTRPELAGAGEESWFAAMGVRLTSWAVILGLNSLAVVPPVAMLLGMWAAHRRVLEEPHDHLPLLRRVAVLGVAIGPAGSLPSALQHVGLIDIQQAAGLTWELLFVMQWTTGLAGGMGYVALFGLTANALSARARASTPVLAVSALGKRSLSGYLSHSVVMAPVLAAWGLGLGASLTSASMAAFAVGLWLLTVIAALALDRAGLRGPGEWLLRKLIYR